MAERVWEKFLTEQDKATLVGKADRRIGFGERPALLLIDLYRWVFGDKPEAVTEAIKTWPGVAGWRLERACRIFKNCSPKRARWGFPLFTSPAWTAWRSSLGLSGATPKSARP